MTIGIALSLAGCSSCPPPFEPCIFYAAPQNAISALPTPFKTLQKDELQTLWGKELYLGTRFADEGDGYRAITAFKSSLYLLPKREIERRQQLEFYIVLSYYFAGKYKEAIETYEGSSLLELRDDFPAKRELWLVLWESYTKLELLEKADCIKLKLDLGEQKELTLSEALQKGDLATSKNFCERTAVSQLLGDFELTKKSPEKAQVLQAIVPGMGYWYVEQKKSAITSFIINTLFIAAAAEFCHHGYYAPALITLSLEMGWYFGGINGVALAANEYNERLYEGMAKETMIKERLFPVMRFEFAF